MRLSETRQSEERCIECHLVGEQSRARVADAAQNLEHRRQMADVKDRSRQLDVTKVARTLDHAAGATLARKRAAASARASGRASGRNSVEFRAHVAERQTDGAQTRERERDATGARLAICYRRADAERARRAALLSLPIARAHAQIGETVFLWLAILVCLRMLDFAD